MLVKRRTSHPLAEEALLWPLRNPTRSKVPIVGQRSPLAKARIFTTYYPTTDCESLVRCVADGDGHGRQAEPNIGMRMLLKRIMDVFVSSLALLFLWPLMLVIGIAVKLGSHGPVIYRSLRVGKCGREFDCYKFRTMVAGSDGLKENLIRLNQRRGPFFKIADDPRVTVRQVSSQIQSRRTAATLERAERGHELGWPATSSGRRLCSIHLRPLPAPRRETRCHRALAGHGPR